MTDDTSALKSGIVLENLDRSIEPGDDFMNYANGTWLANTQIPADKSSYGAFVILRDKAQENIKVIIEMASKQGANGSLEQQQVGSLYSSYMAMSQRDVLGIQPLNEEKSAITDIEDYIQLARYFARANIRGGTSPLQLYISPDRKNPSQYALYTWQGDLGLPDRSYYLQQDEKSVELRLKYGAHINRMFTLAGWTTKQGSLPAKVILELETKLAQIQMKKEDTRNWDLLYNKQTDSQLSQLMPQFHWPSFFEEAGITGQRNIVVTQLDFTRQLDTLIIETPLSTWKTYLLWGLLNSNAGYLNTTLDRQNFEFYGKTLSGTVQQRPLWRRAVATVNHTLGEVVGKVYVQKHFPLEAKQRMQTMVDNLIQTYAESIKSLSWMGDKTKIEALRKLNKFTAKIGYPDKWKDYSTLVVDPNELVQNIIRSRQFSYRRYLNRLDKPVDREEWFANPQTVNAYYNPAMNQIVFPAAILQTPFFNLEADDAVNYGAIGAVIGHEIGHGFDDSGSTFDGDGALRDWWTKQDKQEFKTRTQQLVDQYNGYKVADDLYVNGEYTLGENIGDLGGLSIAYMAWQRSLAGNESPEIDGFSGQQRVFLGWAQSWATKRREKALRRMIKTDSHSPSRFRVNGVVRNIPAFYQAFDLQPNNSLYLTPDKRVKIW